MKKKKEKGKNPLSTLLLLICLAVAGFSAYKLYTFYRGYHDADEEYEALTDYVNIEEEEETEDGKKQKKCPITVDFPSLQAINPDVVAWIYIPKTQVNYPVAQGEDNEYYLNYSFEKKRNFCGAIYLDAKCQPDFSSDNSIVFGHNMKNGSMFGELKTLYDKAYNEGADWRKHPVVWVVTPQWNMEYKIYAAREIETGLDEDVYMIDFAQREGYARWIEEQKQASQYKTKASTESLEPSLTLSTCTSTSENGRFVVHAIRVGKTARQ
ncbi:MAG: class B sortase [Eubacteriales bacterium]|nr:class B sortase [Eubacteriales bacterium]